jgi:hypothetical protein
MEFTKRQIATGNRRLLRLADILDKVPADKRMPDYLPAYYQRDFVHKCGSPACALGYWAAANKRRWTVVDRLPRLKTPIKKWPWPDRPGLWDDAAQEFALDRAANDGSDDEARLLFGMHGCGNAKTGPQAAKYIRDFVAKRTA